MKNKLAIIIGLVFYNCSSGVNEKINGNWELVACNHHISESFKFLVNTELELIERKLKSNFPKKLNRGDKVYFGESKELKINGDISYSFYTSDNKLNISHLDIVFPLSYHIKGDTLTLSRTIDQGSIIWKLKRIKQ